MSEVWCIVGGSDGRDRYLAEELIRTGNSVAILKNDVSQLAMLVNTYGEAILPIEIRDSGDEALVDALAHVEASYGHVDAIAVVVDWWPEGTDAQDPPDLSLTKRPAGFEHAAEVLAANLPGSRVVIVTGRMHASAEDRLTARMLNTVLEDRLRHAALSGAQAGRPIDVLHVADVSAQLGEIREHEH
ncbi:NAD(P)-dependent dehydrogenase (short-subunit alcohol dehydrogenase family) [Okibacterium sp. HSC-33S16]|uniref:hypothetical protein n=1 Tax=Okibacterium sp. HSC-33S16 TaxID=2910965 RepID=UPI0020A14EE1|nr:hypothetical protein [Okibacterium sp. HSC-33S16]MCP2032134.1 NAD(P)-dependent dehydrogenase (short-subunit alcohol dehydrogenase family) [Okibacterium sp. HSC-33S16]